MIFAEKLIQLRKKCGWSQEELADKLNVTRQSVSKWEGAQSIPELDKILLMSNLFGVSTDDLLRDERTLPAEGAPAAEHAADDAPLRRVSLQEASDFLRVKRETTAPIAFAVLACILSPVPLMLLTGLVSSRGMTERAVALACGVGLIVLLLIVAAAVAVFLTCDGRTKRFHYLDTEPFETEYGVTGMVRERQEQLRASYTRSNILGACLCILSPIPLFSGMFFTEDGLCLLALLCCTIALVGAGVTVFILAGIPWASLEKLLQEGDYTRDGKRLNRVADSLSTVYWLIVVAIYLCWSFYTNDWQRTWIIWAIAGVLFPVLLTVSRVLAGLKKR